jgi:hypothetical protein
VTQTRAIQQPREQADGIRPFRVNFPEAELTDLLRRINAQLTTALVATRFVSLPRGHFAGTVQPAIAPVVLLQKILAMRRE